VTYISAPSGRSKAKAAPALGEFPQKPAPLHRHIAAAMGRRRVAAVFPPGRDSAYPAEMFFIVRGDVVAQLELLDGDGGDFHDRHFAAIDAVT
jgi:hypothetical protein